MDDAIDLRTRLIYASLADDDLVRELRQARSRVHLATGASRSTAGSARPWLVGSAAPDDLMEADVTAAGEGSFVIDVRDPDAPQLVSSGRAADGSDDPAMVVHQRTSEWSLDDPSYYLG